MTTIAYFLSGVTMFMIMFGFIFIANEVSEERNIVLVITFIGVAIAVFLAYPLVQLFERMYADNKVIDSTS